MTTRKPKLGQVLAGAGGVLLIVSLFLPWASAADADRAGFELLTMGDVFLLIVGLVAIGAALTWGRFGLFRPDLSLTGAADLLGVVATIVVAWLILFDFPSGANREIGVYPGIGRDDRDRWRGGGLQHPARRTLVPPNRRGRAASIGALSEQRGPLGRHRR